MKLKIGDKVKIVKFPDRHCVGVICIIIGTPNFTGYPYQVMQIDNNDWVCLMRADEIEKVHIKGEQLLLFEVD